MAETEKPGYLDPFAVVAKIAVGAPGPGTGFAAHQAKAWDAAGRSMVSEPEPDYTTWLSGHDIARMLGVGYRTGWTLGKRYVTWVKIYGKVLFDPESAAEYKKIHDITRRSPRPAGD